MREGEDEFFQLKVNGLLQESGRVQVVERELLDKLLEELKLSTTDLVDPQKALAGGKDPCGPAYCNRLYDALRKRDSDQHPPDRDRDHQPQGSYC